MSGPVSIEAQIAFVQQTLWSRRWLGIAVAWTVALLAVPIVMVMPNRYEASAQIYVDTQTVLKPLMQGLAFTPDTDQQVRMLARTLITRPNVEKLIEDPRIGMSAGASVSDRERSIAQLMARIKISAAGQGNLFLISYQDTDPVRARRMVDTTLELFVNAGAISQKRDSAEASQFIDEQIKTYEAKLVEAENKLKEFKLRNFGVSGVSNQDFFGRMSALSEEVGRLRVDLAAAEQARDALRRELASEDPQLPADAAGGGVPVVQSELDARLEAQKRLLDDMLRRFTDDHPDVISTRRIIAQLENQKRLEAQAREGTRGRASAATSPVYQRIRVALAETEAQVASLRSQLALKEARLEQIRATANKVPQVEAELAQLNRDYDIMHKNYQALVARRESASLGVKMDESSRLADFRVVEPPRVGPSPVFPSRMHLGATAAALAIALGVAVPLLLQVLFPTYRDADSLERATGRPVLGSVTMVLTEARRRAMRGQSVAVATSIAGLMLLQAGWLIWLFKRVPS